ncbi:MAG: DUF2079 domain-containing protein [Propionibacteriaceae bacterium]|nr:DUF2079 domain-containing protein [Propionibacteriaceae bacterium]
MTTSPTAAQTDENAATLASGIPRPTRREKPGFARRDLLFYGLLAGIAILCSLVYAAVSLGRYDHFQTGEDLGLFGEAVRSYADFSAPLSALKAQGSFNLLGDHFTPIIAALAPFYKLWPDVRLLLVAQALLFGATAAAIGLACRSQLRPWAGLLVAGAFGLSWGVVEAAAYDFHETAFAVPFLAFALLAARARRWRVLWIFCGLLWLTKEDMTFFTAGLALTLLAQKQVRQAAALAAASVTVFAVLVWGVIPRLSFYGRYTYFSVVADETMAASVARHLSTPAFWVYLAALAVTAGLGLLSPLALAGLPVIASRLVSSDDAYLSFGFHYNATLMTVCFIALADGWARWRRDPGQGTLNPSLRWRRAAAGGGWRQSRTLAGCPRLAPQRRLRAGCLVDRRGAGLAGRSRGPRPRGGQ